MWSSWSSWSSLCWPAALWWARRDGGAVYFTGFVEGEERVIRSEVVGRVLEVPFAEGATVPPGAVVARLDESDIAARLEAKQRELDVTRADMRTQEERIGLVESTWKTGVDARRAEVTQAESALLLAERTFAREAELVETGASTAQLLDETRARRDQARSELARARDLLAQANAEERNIAVDARPARDAAPARGARRGADRRARGDARQVPDPRAGRRDGRADAVRVAGRARAAGHAGGRGARPRGQVRAGVPAGRGDVGCARRTARRDRARQRARPAHSGRGQLHRRPGQLHAGEDRDPRGSRRTGLPRQGAHPRGRGAAQARARRATSTSCTEGDRACRSDADRATAAGAAPRSACVAWSSATARRRRCAASTWRWPARRSSASSVPTVPARRRCCARSPGCSRSRPTRRMVLGHDLRGDVRR